MITHLINTTEFVKLLNSENIEVIKYFDNYGVDKSCHFRRLVCNYADFISQKPEMWMFVPCDENGCVLTEPENYAQWYEYDELGLELYFGNDAECERYKKAQSKVLFKNITNKPFVKIVRDRKFNFNGLFYNNQYFLEVDALNKNMPNLEYLCLNLKLRGEEECLELTDTAIKQLI